MKSLSPIPVKPKTILTDLICTFAYTCCVHTLIFRTIWLVNMLLIRFHCSRQSRHQKLYHKLDNSNYLPDREFCCEVSVGLLSATLLDVGWTRDIGRCWVVGLACFESEMDFWVWDWIATRCGPFDAVWRRWDVGCCWVVDFWVWDWIGIRWGTFEEVRTRWSWTPPPGIRCWGTRILLGPCTTAAWLKK